MLAKFNVSNFKGFNEKFEFDLTQVNNYSFNNQSVKNGIINNAIIYGHNGVGKSNLALGIFDIIEHLTDKYNIDTQYTNYQNAYSKSECTEFYYEFRFAHNKVVYEYKKTSYKIIVYEKFSINNQDLAFIDRRKSNIAQFHFKGTENLKNELPNRELSILKYVKSNTQLELNEINNVFEDFFRFIDSMLFFKSLEERIYIGVETGARNIIEDIIENKNVKDFEAFLKKAGIPTKLKVVNDIDKKILAYDFGNKRFIEFMDIASQGTRVLTLFYYWFQRIKQDGKVQFLFIDEFDAYYHHELSAFIIDELKKTGTQFILTTHNTSNLTNDILRPDCYFLMKNDNIRSLAKISNKELREAHNIEKMYKAGSFDV